MYINIISTINIFSEPLNVNKISCRRQLIFDFARAASIAHVTSSFMCSRSAPLRTPGSTSWGSSPSVEPNNFLANKYQQPSHQDTSFAANQTAAAVTGTMTAALPLGMRSVDNSAAARFRAGRGPSTGIPPPGYVCKRCNRPGHYIHVCPTNADPSYDRPRSNMLFESAQVASSNTVAVEKVSPVD